ncbi:hypothetical protein [Promicromonospora kroppenstedtii]|nr:hypothetical protein [Promicromonospora kroppenstedtii]
MTSLSFHGQSRGIPIAEVPPVVLAETYREYLEISAGGEYRPAARDR